MIITVIAWIYMSMAFPLAPHIKSLQNYVVDGTIRRSSH